MIKKKIVIAHFGSVIAYPPVINLIDCLLANSQSVVLISMDGNQLPVRILENKNFKLINLRQYDTNNIFESIKQKLALKSIAKKSIIHEMKDADILWTTTDFTVRWLGDVVLKYNHVMQLMELIKFYPMFPRLMKYLNLQFPIDKYARNAKRIVVPEVNRAYIQQVWWNLKLLPMVLPNKPYYLCLDENKLDPKFKKNLDKIKSEKRKVILYSGVLWFDRDFDSIAKSIEKLDDKYALYIMGNVPDAYKETFYDLLQQHTNIIYLGYFPAPQHLIFYKYAYIGLLPYRAGKISCYNTHISELNALYCAPNKIYEYAGVGLPMIGTNVLGLKIPFEQYDIGVCCSNLSGNKFIDAICYINNNYETMKKNCEAFYKNTDLNKIIMQILAD
ncbi:hypothetical protein [Butyribacter sp.]|uniref:hypothetical protein n=1 Tax=Butyribacter sp. TaxID=2822465 RepID=UPI002A9A6E9C|nr:hypothetical protein [Butyribacter sp.]